MKKKLISLLTVMFTLIMGTTVFAGTSGDGTKLDKRIETLQERQQKIEEIKTRNQERQSQLASKKDEFEAFRKALAEQRLDVLENRENTISVTEQNIQLRLALAQKLKEMKDSGTVLPDETTAQIKELNTQIAELVNSLKDTKGQIKETKEEYKDLIKEKDYAAMDTAFAEISSIQENRLDILNQINSILQEMNNLLSIAH